MITAARATIHRIIAAFDGALRGLGLHTDPLNIERWSVLVHEAMANRARFFHGSEHIFDVVRGTDDRDDPLQTLAILFHDVVYVQVDGALDARVLQILRGAVRYESGVYRVGNLDAVDEPVAHQVAQVFGLSAGEELSPFSGLNEFASALVAARQLVPVLPLSSVIAIAACIEATIPFRGPVGARGTDRDRDDGHGHGHGPSHDHVNGDGPYDQLADRLRRLDGRPLDEAAVVAAVTRAVRVANSDVGNFGDEDPATFLDHTWDLLPETNPALQLPTAYSVRQYRIALFKMETFLSSLTADRVFHQWGGVPDETTYRGLVARAARNLDVAVRYLRAKLYTAAIVEALAMASGGDAPLELFAGAIPRPGLDVNRIDQHLPPPSPQHSEPAADADAKLLALFVKGRAHDSSFDLRASPLSAYLYRRLGESGVQSARASIREFSSSRITAIEFLQRQPAAAIAVITSIAQAASQVAVTRTGRLNEIAQQLCTCLPR